MRVFQDLITGSEYFADSKMFSGCCKEEHCAYVVKGEPRKTKQGIDGSLIGANASQEEPNEQQTEDGCFEGIDVIVDFGLCETAFGSKKDMLTHYKGYFAKLIKKIPEDKQDEFKEHCKDFMGAVSKRYKDLQFFHGQGTDALEDGFIIPVLYGDSLDLDICKDSQEPYFYFLKDALEDIKC